MRKDTTKRRATISRTNSRAIEQEVGRRVDEATAQIEAEATARIEAAINAPYESIGNWDGSETFHLLGDKELQHIAMSLAEQSGGEYYTGLLIVLLEHLGKLAFEKRFNDLEYAIAQVREQSYKADHFALDTGIEALRVSTRQSLTESLADLAA